MLVVVNLGLNFLEMLLLVENRVIFMLVGLKLDRFWILIFLFLYLILLLVECEDVSRFRVVIGKLCLVRMVSMVLLIVLVVLMMVMWK